MKRLASLVLLGLVLALSLLSRHDAQAVIGLSGAPANAAWNPGSLNPKGWWRSDLGVTGTSTVTQWNDQSGNGYNLTVDTGNGATAPAYSASGGPNNVPRITFSGSSTTGMKNASFLNTGVMDAFIVATTTTSTATSNNFLLDGARAGGGSIQVYQQASANTLAASMDGVHVVTLPTVANVPFIAEANLVASSSSSFITLGGGSTTSGSPGTSATNTDLGVGHASATLTGSSAFGWAGDIDEIVIFEGVTLSAGQRTQILNYLKNRYYPTDIPTTNLLMRMRADHVVSPVSGAKFSQWVDMANSGATYTQATSANQFTWLGGDALFGGQPSVTSAAATYLTTSVVPTVSAPFTVYGMVAASSTASTELLFTNSAATVEGGIAGAAWYSYLGGPGAGGTAAAINTPYAVAWLMSTSGSVYVNNSATANWTGTSPGTSTALTMVLGYNGGSLGWIGNEAEIIVYQGAQTQAQIANTFQYMARRYGTYAN
jgi:hypothetical protein